jgi:serine protease Do
MIITRGVPQSAGVGFAVPINVAKGILDQLRERGKVIRGWLGVQIQNVTEDMAKTLGMDSPRGAIVSDVTRESPAANAGVQPGDVIVAVDDREMEDNNDLSSYIASKAPGTRVELKVLREGSDVTLSVTLGTFPEEGDLPDVSERASAQLGMTLHDLTPELAARLELPRGTQGVVVMDVEAGGAAEDANLQQFDVIVSVNRARISSIDDFESAIEDAEADGLARLRVRRGNNHFFTVLKLR